MIEGAPKKNRHIVDFRSELVLVVPPGCASLPQRTLDQTDSPNSPTLMPQVFGVTQRQRKPDVEHHRKPDDLRAGLEVARRGALSHADRLAGHPNHLKKSSPDRAAGSNPEAEALGPASSSDCAPV